jgi:hypothetical protein
MSGIESVFKHRIGRWAYIFLGLAAIVSGCARGPEMARVVAELPKAHVWASLCEAGKEDSGYAMYTYVLINRSKADIEAWKRYVKLVEAIEESTIPAVDHAPGFDRSLYNIFLIPESCGISQRADSLNDRLSKSILTGIAASVQERKLRDLINTSPGPFLISAVEPISSENLHKEIELLYVDLSRTNPEALREVVAAYKKRVTSGPIDRVEEFKSIRLSLLTVILDADHYISIVKVAYAGWIGE